MDNRGKSRANTCKREFLFEKGMHILDTNPKIQRWIIIFIANHIEIYFLDDKPIKFLPYHTLDGNVVDYGGDDG